MSMFPGYSTLPEFMDETLSPAPLPRESTPVEYPPRFLNTSESNIQRLWMGSAPDALESISSGPEVPQFTKQQQILRQSRMERPNRPPMAPAADLVSLQTQAEQDYARSGSKREFDASKDLTGVPQERYQTWPERIVRETAHAVGSLATGESRFGSNIALPGTLPPDSPGGLEGYGHVFEAAGAMVFGPATFATKVAKGTLGSFAGVGAKTHNAYKEMRAEELLAKGASPEEVWKKTGLFKGLDEKWRFEIPSQKANLTAAADTIRTIPSHIFEKSSPTGVIGNLENVLHHPELYKAYPELKDMKVALVRDKTAKWWGEFDPSIDKITINLESVGKGRRGNVPPAEVVKRILLHEVQHMIQKKEGFFPGTNEVDVMKDLSVALMGRVNAAMALRKEGKITKEEFIRRLDVIKNATNLVKPIQPQVGKALYERSPGEIEARMVELRTFFKPKEVSSISPMTSYTLARKNEPSFDPVILKSPPRGAPVTSQPISRSEGSSIIQRERQRSDEFMDRNNLPRLTEEQFRSNLLSRQRQIEYDRRLGGKPEGGYPPHAELKAIRDYLRTPNLPEQLEQVLSSYAQGNMNASQVRDAFKKEGWGVGLRRKNDVEVTDPKGKVYHIPNTF